MVLSALILICSIATTPDLAACNQTNAVSMLRVPEDFGSPVTCFVHGQAYLAETSIGRDLTADERVKVVCARKVSSTTAAVPTR
jgi:hypothetical protein